VVVDIADMIISENPQETLVTYSLGSCLGITFYDPSIPIGGMIHCMLPLSKIDPQKAKERPAMFVDTGVQQLLRHLFQRGLRKARTLVNVAGGAHVLDNQGLFKIGERNFTVLRKILWKNNMLMNIQDVGGNTSRTIRLDIGTGRFVIKTGGQETVYDI
jgi:chemotaxis protein CheD